MHGISSAGLSLGRGVVVCGAGPIGLIALAAARASGAHPIVITDLEPTRLSFAKKFVPSALTYQVNRALDAEGNAKEIRRLFDFENLGEYGAPEVVLECTGVESSVITAAYAARRGGTLMVIGVGRETMNNLPFMHLSLGEVSTCPLPRSQRRSDSIADQLEVHQPVPRYLARGPAVPCRWHARSEATRQSQVSAGGGVGRVTHLR
jgi:threonine dehydrogenase-like Zn-dependent dehydrogenase